MCLWSNDRTSSKNERTIDAWIKWEKIKSKDND